MTAPIMKTKDAATALLCSECYTDATGLLAECEDGCSKDLNHDGQCLTRGGQTECDECGCTERLTEVEQENRLDYVQPGPAMRPGTTYEGYVRFADKTIVSLQCFENRHGECPDPSCAGGTPADDGIGCGPLGNGYYCECPGC